MAWAGLCPQSGWELAPPSLSGFLFSLFFFPPFLLPSQTLGRQRNRIHFRKRLGYFGGAVFREAVRQNAAARSWARACVLRRGFLCLERLLGPVLVAFDVCLH